VSRHLKNPYERLQPGDRFPFSARSGLSEKNRKKIENLILDFADYFRTVDRTGEEVPVDQEKSFKEV
jgi:uncharacterized phage-like protein YoqJ